MLNVKRIILIIAPLEKMTTIIPRNYLYIRRVAEPAAAGAGAAGAAAAAAPVVQEQQPKKLQSKADEKEKEIWDTLTAFLNEHQALFINHPYKRCNIRFVADRECEVLINRLRNIRIPYLAGRDQLDVDLFYYYIIGSGHDFYYSVIDNQEVARPIWEQRLFEPKIV